MALTRSKKTIIPTIECYDAWSNTYDSDGNVLQLLDDVAFDEICRPLLTSTYRDEPRSICCELGCGTGRNTMKVLQANWSVIALDLSTSMMAKAQERVKQLEEQSYSSSISWIIDDLNSNNRLSIADSSVDAVISTLVLEHISSLDRFFKIIYRILKKNEHNWVFLTAMHPNMYRAGSQAGFIRNETTGDKLCGISFDHSIEQIIDTAAMNNLMLIKYWEKGITNDEDAGKFGSRAKKWIGTNIHLSFLFQIEKTEIKHCDVCFQSTS